MKAEDELKKMMISFFSLMKFTLLQVEQPDLWMPLTCFKPLAEVQQQR
jgi:hypothetical protein